VGPDVVLPDVLAEEPGNPAIMAAVSTMKISTACILPLAYAAVNRSYFCSLEEINRFVAGTYVADMDNTL
jgi:hypothetical protein